ncbi:MAG: D-alanyl-D-alanine carboxypeptidase/D-alanyl-D-alanine-endopeptidase [Tannerella sp.]|nr:D-alanyl-D-alanine carboxypeptidase/D-alanyl-D-alanine-endopeptidase [Tannerella sp.]
MMKIFFPVRRALLVTVCSLCAALPAVWTQAQEARMEAAFGRFLRKEAMRGASVSFMAREVRSGDVVYGYDAERRLTPASVVKTVTAAAALELLGGDFRFATAIRHDGHVRDGVLHGNLFICGSGDPTAGSSRTGAPRDSIPALWAEAVERAGIRRIDGRVIADESIFDTEGVSMKWLREDLGSGYGQGSYGVNLFDNMFRLYLSTGAEGATPSIVRCDPPVPALTFHNYLMSRRAATDSFYIAGAPYDERYLYGAVRAGLHRLEMEGDIPDPPLFAARYFCDLLKRRGVEIAGEPSCHRLLTEAGAWPEGERRTLVTTYSPALREIVRITNFFSCNMYADALVKTLGLRYRPGAGEAVSSFERGTRVVAAHWAAKGLDTGLLTLHDGSGLAAANRATAAFLCDMYVYMAGRSEAFAPFLESLPGAGVDGTVRTFLKGTALEGSRLKSGGMSGVRCYGGYIDRGGRRYAVALLVNHFTGSDAVVRAAIEELFLSLF